MQIAENNGLLFALHIDSVNLHESQLLMKTIKSSVSQSKSKYKII